MPDGEYTAMNAVEAASLDAPSESSAMNAGRLELRQSDHAVLPGRYPSNLAVSASLGTF